MVNSESKDFCLCERLHACEGAYAMDVSKHWDRIKILLGDRIMYMNYTGNVEKGIMNDGYIMDILLASKNSTLGIEVAAALKTLIPFCHYCEFGRPIVITDHPNLQDVPDCVEWDGGWYVDHNAKELQKCYQFVQCNVEVYEGSNVSVFEDTRFLVILMDDKEKVHMHIHKK